MSSQIVERVSQEKTDFSTGYSLDRLSASASAASGERERAGIRQRRLCGGDWHHPGLVLPARKDRDRRLADGRDWHRIACGTVPLEGEQSAAHRGDRCRWPYRLSLAAAGMGDGEIATATGKRAPRCIQTGSCEPLQME